jgi:hypothetical protein
MIDFAALVTNNIVDDRNRQEGRFNAAEERVRRIENRDKHLEMIKKLPKMTSGQLMANGWLCMDTAVLEKQQI